MDDGGHCSFRTWAEHEKLVDLKRLLTSFNLVGAWKASICGHFDERKMWSAFEWRNKWKLKRPKQALRPSFMRI